MKSQSSHCRVKGAWHDTQTGYSSPTCIKAVSFNCVLFFFFFNLMQMYHSSPFPFSSPCKIHWPAIFSQHSFSTYTRVRKTSDLSSHSHRIRALLEAYVSMEEIWVCFSFQQARTQQPDAIQNVQHIATHLKILMLYENLEV